MFWLLCYWLSIVGITGAYADPASQWQISTVFSDNKVVANGGVVHDKDQPHILYVSSKTQKMIWKVDLKAGITSELAGSSTMLYGFQSPRGMCQSPVTGDLLVVDGVGNTAILRTVNVKTGLVLTVLGNPSGSRPVDGSGSSAVLSSGSWWLSCLPDGSAVLADTQTRSWRHICPPGWTDNCGNMTRPSGPAPPPPPAPAPSPPTPAPPADHCSTAAHWWQIITAALVGMGVGGAAVGGAGSYVSGKIKALREKHCAAPAAVINSSGGDVNGVVNHGGLLSVRNSLQATRPWWPTGASRESMHYEVLPGFRDSHEATTATAAANSVRNSTNFTWTPVLPDTSDTAAPAGEDQYDNTNKVKTQTSKALPAIQSPGAPLATSLEVPDTAAAALKTPALVPAAAAPSAAGVAPTLGGSSWTLPAAVSHPYVTNTGSERLSNVVSQAAVAAATFQAVPDGTSNGHTSRITVETFRKGSGNSLHGAGFPVSPSAAATGTGTDQNMTGCYSVDIYDTNAYEPLPTGSSAALTRGGVSPRSDISGYVSSGRAPPHPWHNDQQQQRQRLFVPDGPGSVSWPVGDVDGRTTTASSVDMSVRTSLDGSEIRALLGTDNRNKQQ